MIRKTLLFILSFVMLFLSGCDDAADTSEELTENQINIKFSFWEPGMYRELENALQKIADQYEAEHPNIHIELISKPVDSYFDWIKTCYVADDMPDIESAHSSTISSQYLKGMIVDITDVFNSESAYAPGKPWKDTFIQEKFMAVNADYKNSYCNIPIFGTELGMYYNKTVYDELGLTVPETWRQFMDNCKIIKSAGKTPIVIPGQKKAAFSWLDWEIGQALSINRFLADKNININNDNTLSLYEKHRAVLLGYVDFVNDKEMQGLYKTTLEHYREYLSYCDGSSDLEESIAKTMFINGEAVHINSGAWDAKSFLDNNDVKFEVGTFKFPQFTSEDTDYPGKRIRSNTAQSLGITTSVYKQEGKLEAVIDFLQYLTSKDVYQQFIYDTMEIPVVKDVTAPEAVECFIFDGYSICSDFMYNLDAFSVIDGTVGELDADYFKNINKIERENAEEFMQEQGLSADDDYYMTEEVIGGYFDG